MTIQPFTAELSTVEDNKNEKRAKRVHFAPQSPFFCVNTVVI